MFKLLQYDSCTQLRDERSGEPQAIPWPYDLAVIIPTVLFLVFLLGCFCLYCAADSARTPYVYRVQHAPSYAHRRRNSGLSDSDYPPLIERVSVVFNPDDQACLATEEHKIYGQSLVNEPSSGDLESGK